MNLNYENVEEDMNMDDEDSEDEQKNEKQPTLKKTTKRKTSKTDRSSENESSETENEDECVTDRKPSKKKAKKQQLPAQDLKKEEKKNNEHCVVVTSTGCLNKHSMERKTLILDILNSQVLRLSQAAALRSMAVQIYFITLLEKQMPIPEVIGVINFWSHATKIMCKKNKEIELTNKKQWQFDLDEVSKFMVSAHPNLTLPSDKYLSHIIEANAQETLTNFKNLHTTTYESRQRSTIKSQILKRLLQSEKVKPRELYSYTSQICARINGFTFKPKKYFIPDHLEQRFKSIEDEHLKYLSPFIETITNKKKKNNEGHKKQKISEEYTAQLKQKKKTQKAKESKTLNEKSKDKEDELKESDDTSNLEFNKEDVKDKLLRYILCKINNTQFKQRTPKNGPKPKPITVAQEAFTKSIITKLKLLYPNDVIDKTRMATILHDMLKSPEIFDKLVPLLHNDDEKKEEKDKPDNVEFDEELLQELEDIKESMNDESRANKDNRKINKYVIEKHIHLIIPYFYYMWKQTYPTITFNLIPQTSRRPLSILLGASQLECFLQDVKEADHNFYDILNPNGTALRKFVVPNANEILDKVFDRPKLDITRYTYLPTVTTNGRQFSFHRSKHLPISTSNKNDIKNFKKGIKYYPQDINVTKETINDKYCISVDPGRINLLAATRHGYGFRPTEDIKEDLENATSKKKEHKFSKELHQATIKESTFSYQNSDWRRDTKMQYALSKRQQWQHEAHMHIIDNCLSEKRMITLPQRLETREEFIQRITTHIEQQTNKAKSKMNIATHDEHKGDDDPVKKKKNLGRRRRAQKKKKKLKQYEMKKKNDDEIKAALPTTYVQRSMKRTNRFHSYLRYVDVILSNWKTIYDHVFQSKYLKLKVECYQAKQKAVIKLASNLVGDINPSKSPTERKKGEGKLDGNRMDFSKVYLLWGGGSFSPTGKGHPAAPNKLIYKALSKLIPVIITNEKNTSKLTRCCRVPTIHPPRSKKDQTPIERVSKCSNCGQYWNRDESASGFIYDLFKQHVHTGEWLYTVK